MEKQGESDHSLETLENLEMLSFLFRTEDSPQITGPAECLPPHMSILNCEQEHSRKSRSGEGLILWLKLRDDFVEVVVAGGYEFNLRALGISKSKHTC